MWLAPQIAQPVDHVAEILVVPALVGTDRDAVGIFLDRGAHDVVDAAVVTEVDDLRALRLDQAPHDVDRGVVAVEQRRRGHEPQRGLGGLSGYASKVTGNRAHGIGSCGRITAKNSAL